MPNFFMNQIREENEGFFTQERHYGPVTALKVTKEHIFCGYGPTLKIFDLNYRLLSSVKLFQKNKIHHISVTSDGKTAVATGGRSFRVVDIANPEESAEKAMNEWIVCAEFYEGSLLILTSHNIVYEVSLPSFKFTKTSHCNEKSILYSGSIRVTDSRVVVCAGTVMDGVIVWDWHTNEILHRLTDHKGSIFGVRVDPELLRIVSCSDDRSVKLYDFNGAILAEGWGHGSRIWNLEFLDNNKLMSTGEDCTMRIWQYDGTPTLQQIEVNECHLGKHVWSGDTNGEIIVTGGADGRVRVHDVATEVATKYEMDVQSVSDVGGTLYALSSGELYILSEKWEKVAVSEPAEYKFLRTAGEYLVMCTHYGDMMLISDKQTFFKGQGNKITNVLTTKNDDDIFILLDCPNPKVPFYVKHLHNGVVNEFTLDQPKQASFTASAMVFDRTNNWLVVCSRYVSIAVYDLATKEPVVFRKMCPGDTITDVAVVESDPGCVHLRVIVRDGVYMYVRVSRDSYKITHRNKLSRGFLEGSYTDGEDLILYGFKSGYFYLWNETKQCEITKEQCGGSHRLWGYFPESNKLVYVLKSLLYVKQHRKKDLRLLEQGTHGREIRSVSISPQGLVATASEDTIVRLGRITPEKEIQYYWCMNNHVSGMQKVKFLGKDHMASSAANEEFFIWKLDKLKNGTPLINEIARIKPSSDTPDLRIMDFASYETPEGFIIATVYSNSCIKVWSFNGELQLLVSDFYATCCILHVDFLDFGGQKYLLVAATDGHIAVWPLNLAEKALGAPVIRQQLHQSGIKALLIEPQDDGYRLVTGGDDNALIVSTLSKEIKWTLLHFKEQAASATITGISGSKGRFITTSVDQIVRAWDEELNCVAARYTTVADTGCLDTTEDLALIGGAGLSVWSTSTT